MTWVRRFIGRLTAFVRSGRAERELTRELEAHLSMLEADFSAKGLSPDAARAAARRAIGGVDQTRERHRDERSFPWLEDLRRDVPYALRGLKRHAGFTAAAVLTLALGIGITAAVLSLIHAIAYRPLPYDRSDRLVQIVENVVRDTPAGPRSSRRFAFTQAEFLEWRSQATTFTAMAGVINLMSGTMQSADGHIPAPRAIVSPALFEILDVQPLLGRVLVADDERPNAEAALISAAAWQRFFGADPDILGRSITLNNLPFTIVGVMPPGFDFPEASTMFWTALAPRPGPGTNVFGFAVARLKADASIESADAEANVIGAAVRKAAPVTGYGAAGPPPPPATPTMGGPARLDLSGRPRFEVLRLRELMAGPIGPQLRLLAVAVAVVLLVVCANVANLLLARATARHREVGVRLALGAGRGRLVRQMLTESAVLAFIGGLAGLAVAAATLRLVTALATVQTPRLFQLSINLDGGSLLPRVGELGADLTLFGMTVATALLASLACGLAPAIHASGVSAPRVLVAGGLRTDGQQPRGGHVRTALVLAQVALATVLLVGGALLVQTLVRLQRVDVGYDPRDIVTFQLLFPPQTPGERQLDVIETTIDRLQSSPRVASAGYTNIVPFLAVTEYGGLFVPPGSTREEMLEDSLRPQLRIVSHRFLQTLGTRLVAGRWLEEGDGSAQTPVIVVNRALVRRYFNGGNPIGVTVPIYRSADYVEHWQIAGVVDDVLQARLDQEAFPVMFADPRQVLAARARMPKELQLGQGLPGFPTIAVRVRGPAAPIAAEARAIVRGIDSGVGIDAVASLDDLRYGSLVRPRFYATLGALLAGLVLVLAVIGVYGVLAYVVAQRTQELGIRMALGADRRQVVRDVIARGLAPVAAGVAVGLTAAAGLTRYLESMLFGLTPLDLATYSAAALLFGAVSAVACYLPARRAARIDPVLALRAE